MKAIPYVFYNYSITKNDEAVGDFMHMRLFNSARGNPVAYRTSDPSESQKDTMLVGPKQRTEHGHKIITFHISRRIAERKIIVYDENREVFEEAFEPTKDYATALMVAMPHMGIMAVADKTGDHDINASSSMGRLKAIMKELDGYKLLYDFAAKEEEVRRAFKVWKLHSVNFSARPFNPHPSTPGDILSALMKDNNARMSGKVIARQDGRLQHADDGILNEIVGLGSKGYAQYGAQGVTEKGYNASISKVQPDENVNTPRKIRIFIPANVDVDVHIKDVVHTINELYG